MSHQRAIAEVSPETRRIATRNLRLVQQFTQAMIHDPALMQEIPDGVTLVLVPDDLPDLAEMNIRNGLAAVKRGENVYIRHVYRQFAESDQAGDVIYGPYPPKGPPDDNR